MYGWKDFFIMCLILGHLKPLIFYLEEMEKLMVLGVPVLKHKGTEQCIFEQIL